MFQSMIKFNSYFTPILFTLEFAQVTQAMEFLQKNYDYWNGEAEKLVSDEILYSFYRNNQKSNDVLAGIQ